MSAKRMAERLICCNVTLIFYYVYRESESVHIKTLVSNNDDNI